MNTLQSGGVKVGLPRGWEGEIFNRADEPGSDGPARTLSGPSGSATPAPNNAEVARNVIHLANFALPSERGDFCLLYTSPSPRDATLSRMPSSA